LRNAGKVRLRGQPFSGKNVGGKSAKKRYRKKGGEKREEALERE